MRNAIVIVLILALLGILLFSKDGREEAPDNDPIVTEPDEIEEEDSVQTLPSQDGLPFAVEDKRQAIYQAALSKDYDRLASEAGTPFSYSFGGETEGGFAEHMRRAADLEGESAFDIIPKLLALPYAKNGDIYVWPALFLKTADEWTDEDIALMRTLMSDELIESYRQFGSYAYYRVGIREDGTWVYFIAGD